MARRERQRRGAPPAVDWGLELALAGPGKPRGPIRWKAGGFDPGKQRKFLKWLGRTGCKKDAAGKAGISKTTIDRWRNRCPGFDARFDAAMAMAATELEAIAYKRATEGAEEVVIRDGKVAFIRRKPSDAMLKILLQGANPRKYGAGRMSAADRRRLRLKVEADLRDRLRIEVRQEMEDEQPPVDEVRERIARRLERLRRQIEREREAKGWTRGPSGLMLPPGWVMVRREAAEAAGLEPGRPEDAPEADAPDGDGAEADGAEGGGA